MIISLVIIISIISLNHITQKNTDKTVEILNNELQGLRETIKKSDKSNEEIQNDAKKVSSRWEELDNKMAYYIEHDELEKVKSSLTIIKSCVEMEDYTESIEEIDKCMYILEHIHEKEMLQLDNIF